MSMAKEIRLIAASLRDDRSGVLREMERIANRLEKHMSQLVDQLVSEVAANKSATDSVIVLLNALLAKIQSGIDDGDLAKIQSAVDDVHADTAKLASAVAANTPAAPAPAPTPTGGSSPATPTG